MSMTSMSKRAGIACVLLVLFLAAAVWKFQADWRRYEASHRVDEVQAAPEPFAALELPTVPSQDEPQPWFEIASRNLFSFDRTDFEAVETADLEEAPIVTPSRTAPILFGTMSLGEDRMAMLGSAGQTNRSFQTIRVGESIDGWEIVEIQDKSVLVSAGGFSRTVIMNDPSAQVPRDTARSSEVRDTPPPPPPIAASPEPPAAVSTPSPISPPPGPANPDAEAPPGFRYSPFGYIPIRD